MCPSEFLFSNLLFPTVQGKKGTNQTTTVIPGNSQVNPFPQAEFKGFVVRIPQALKAKGPEKQQSGGATSQAGRWNPWAPVVGDRMQGRQVSMVLC